jgi:ribonuclease P/MRP protein subunit RPP40
VLQAFDSGHVGLLTFLDLSAAFDSLDHSTLLKRLNASFGLRGSVMSWFDSFLSGRELSVSYAGTTSSSCGITCGVPQGSVLGPLLFIMYTSDLFRIVNNHNLKIHMFADDAQIYGFCPPLKTSDLSAQMIACLNEVVSWCSSNRLELNASKSEYMWCSSKQKRRSYAHCPVRCGNSTLSPVSSVKCLGVHLDSDFSFVVHISKTVSACFGMLRQIRSIRRSLSPYLLKVLITSLLFPRLDYCIAALSGTSLSQLKRLQSIIHASARLVFGSRRFSAITPLLHELKWLSVKSRINYRLCVLVHLCRLDQAPVYLSDQLQFVSTLPSRSRLRSGSSSALMAPIVRRPTLGGRAFPAAAARAWNGLPSLISSEKNICSFKRLLKSHLLSRT